MKSFSQFIIEAPDAATQAKALGLKSDQHGGWGKVVRGVWEFMGKTFTNPKTGRTAIEFFNNGTRLGKQDRRQTPREKKLSGTTYINKEIFNIDEWVKCDVSESIGKIIRRGTNYLICVTEDGEMFKPWIKDVLESVTNINAPSGVPADQRLVGTDSYRKYVEKMVPGSEWGKQFINKYKKK